MKKILLLILIISTVIFINYDGAFVFKNQEINIKPTNNSYQGTSVYLINLESSKERLDTILPLVKSLELPFHRVNAIQGSSLTSEEIKEFLDFNNYKNYLGHYPRRGMIGCNLSHLKAWKEFIDSDNEFALFLEDDVSFDPLLLKETIDELKNYNNLWDIVSFEIAHSGTPLTLKILPKTKEKLVVYLTEITHAGAYMLNRKAAIALYNKATPMKMPVDHYFTRPWEFDLIMTGIEPRIAAQTFGDSDVRKTNNTYKEIEDYKELSSLLHKAIYKIKSYIMRFYYNLKIYYFNLIDYKST